MLPDGTYDVIVVDATEQPDGAITLEVTLLAGARKGEVVGVRAAGLDVDPVDALGTPGTLTVTGGEPTVTLEP